MFKDISHHFIINYIYIFKHKMNTILQRGYAYESVEEVGYNLMF